MVYANVGSHRSHDSTLGDLMFEKYENKALELIEQEDRPLGATLGFILCMPIIFVSKIFQIPVVLISIVIGWYYTDEEKK